MRSTSVSTVEGPAGRRSRDLAAQWADEYDIAACAPEQIIEHRKALTDACVQRGRDPTTLQLSILAGVLCGQDLSELEERAVRVRGLLGHAPTSTTAAPLDELPRGWIIGTPDEVSRQVSGFGSLGVTRIMLWPPLHDDLEMVSLIGREVLPAVAAA